MLALDALEGDAPRVWLVLTTRTATLDMSAFYTAREHLLRAIRRRWPAEYACLLEYTTGYASSSGGKRRPHWNVLLKGVGPEHLDELREIVGRVWCPRVDARLAGQYVGPVADAGGLMRYIALHFQKCSQMPPAGFTGQRFNCSRGYFTGCTRAVARRRAREALRLKRELWRAEERGEAGHDAELSAQLAIRQAQDVVWVLTTDRGARVGRTGHDRARQMLPKDRDDGGEGVRQAFLEASALAAARGVMLERVVNPPGLECSGRGSPSAG